MKIDFIKLKEKALMLTLLEQHIKKHLMFHSDRVKHQLIISERSFVEMACSEYFPPKLILI